MGPPASRLLRADVLRVASIGLRTRRLRASLSALGIAIGIASMVAVLGISASSKADLIATLDRLGTNLLRVEPGQSFFGDAAELPTSATRMIRGIEGVQQVAAVESVAATVRRTDRIDAAVTGGITVSAADLSLLATLGGQVREGRWLTAATSRYPVVVLGSVAATRLGIHRWHAGLLVWLGERWFAVAGVLDPVPLSPDLDRSALVGDAAARSLLDADGSATTVYVRADPDVIAGVRELLAATANPEHPEETTISRPSDALAARAAAKTAFTSLLLGLGAVALLVGAIGIANVMVISVLERRSEIGLRRALGATRAHVRIQFLAESLLLAAIGGLAGLVVGSTVTAGYASSRSWEIVVPPAALAGGAAAALVIGGIAGLYPAMRAARLAPTQALRTV
jgi:putative ABC transport system permease protein